MIGFFDIFLDYLRLVSYSLIVISSMRGIFKGRFNNYLFLGDVVIACGLFLAGMHSSIFGKDRALFSDLILTPSSVFWATIHFINFLKNIKNGG
jgi:hypothetical protein